jgi:hypothetical protein
MFVGVVLLFGVVPFTAHEPLVRNTQALKMGFVGFKIPRVLKTFCKKVFRLVGAPDDNWGICWLASHRQHLIPD